MSGAVPESRLLIAGEAVPAASGEWREVRSPATGEPVGRYPQAGVPDLDRAVVAARSAQAAWAARTAYDRETVIRKATALARSRAGEIARLMALEQGKPLNQSTSEVTSACDLIDFYAAEGPRIEGKILPAERADYRSYVRYRPVGVAGLITPWNYPVALLAWKLGPALAAGCACVVKPSPVTPLSPAAFVHALAEGGLPPGLVSVLTSDGPDLGKALVLHAGIDKIAMTGSTATGKAIMREVGPMLKRVSLELGGHCPAIVCADADLDSTAEAIAYKAFRNMGQSCSSINRVYAHASVHDALVERLATIAKKQRIGDGVTDGSVDLGPMATAAALAKVKEHVADALAQGANLICGGGPPPGEAFARGHFYLPTVLTNLLPGMRMAREETFGPVAPVASYTDLNEAIRLANDTPYGLVSYLFSKDTGGAMQLAEYLEAGTVCVNHVAVNTAAGPYQGWKDSGFGVELGRDAIFEYLDVQHVKVRT